MRDTIRNAVLLFGVTVLCSLGHADVIHLKNGRTVEGVIKQETKELVVLDLGVGSMKIRHSKIARIERVGREEQDVLQEKWKDKYFSHRKYVPTEFRPLADRLRNLDTQRASAVQSRKLLSNSEALANEILGSIDVTKRELVQVSKQLKAATPQTDPKAYNERVVRSNRLRADITVKEGELDTLKDRVGQAAERISGYMVALSKAESAFNETVESTRSGPMTADHQRFLDRYGKILTGYASEFSEATVVAEAHAGGTIVKVHVNGKASGRFLLDTGAALMSISETFARRAKISTDELRPTELVLADGSKVEARSVLLSSVQLGDARAENVPAVVLKSVVRRDIDGLLGMTFLKHFVMRFDGATGSLVLKSFHPK